MNRFQKTDIQNKISAYTPLSILLFAAVIIFFLVGITILDSTGEKGGKELLVNTLERDITHCYAVEGQYPPSIAYLEDNYGLTYNKDLYIIDYTLVGSNIRPNVIVLEKNNR